MANTVVHQGAVYYIGHEHISDFNTDSLTCRCGTPLLTFTLCYYAVPVNRRLWIKSILPFVKFFKPVAVRTRLEPKGSHRKRFAQE
jgi:hypothetical protein